MRVTFFLIFCCCYSSCSLGFYDARLSVSFGGSVPFVVARVVRRPTVPAPWPVVNSGWAGGWWLVAVLVVLFRQFVTLRYVFTPLSRPSFVCAAQIDSACSG